MTTVEKLLIQGIRSYSPDEKNVIEFFKPVTLIVGANGSGKTTIIEALKLATTGEMPPNAQKGKSIVHDPKMRGREEVKAQIRLRYTTAHGEAYTCYRSFELKNVKKKQTFRHLDNVIRFMDTSGEIRDLHSKCAELDKLVPQTMGVSKAVLENVIFCHQEDSNWPLSEPKALKLKFDDIFAATRYTKALEAISAIRKDKQKEEKELQVEVARLEVQKKEYEKLEDRIKSSLAQKEALTAQRADWKAQLETLKQNEEENQKILKKIETLKQEIQKLQYQKDRDYKEMHSLEENYQPIEGSDEQLEKFSKEIATRHQDLTSEIRAAEDKLKALKREEDKLTTNMTNLKVSQATIAKEREGYLKRIEERKALVSQLAASHRVGGFEGGQKAERFAAAMKKYLANMELTLAQLKENHRSERDDLLKVERECSRKLTETQQTVSLKQQDHAAESSALRDLEAKLKAQSAAEGDMDRLQQDQEKKEKRFRQLQQTLDTTAMKQEMEQKRKELNRVDKKLDELYSEKDKMDHEKETWLALQVKQKTWAEKRSQAEELLQGIAERVEKMSGKGLNKDAVLSACKNLENECKKKVSEAEEDALAKQLNEARCKANVESLKSKVSSLKSNRDNLNKNFENLKQQLDSVPSDLKYGIKVAEERLKESQEIVANMSAIKKMYELYKHKAKESRCCPVCDRGFDASYDQSTFMETMDTKMRALPPSVNDAKEKAQKHQQNLKMLQEVLGVHEESSKVETELGIAVGNLAVAEREHTEAADLLQESVALQSKEKKKMSLCSEILAKAQKYQDLRDEIDKLKSEVDATKKNPGSSAATLESIVSEIQNSKALRESLSQEINQMSLKIEKSQMELRTAENELNAAKDKLSSHIGAVNVKKELLQQRQQLQSKCEDLSSKLSELQSSIVQLKKEYQAAKERVVNVEKAGHEEEKSIEVKLKQAERDYNKLQTMEDALVAYEAKNTVEEEGKIKSLMADIEGKLLDNAKLQRSEQENIKNKQTVMHDREKWERDVSDNIRFRKLQNSIKETEQKIAEIHQQMEDIQAKYGKLDDLMKKGKESIEIMSGSIYHLEGQVKNIIENIKKDGVALKDPALANVNEKFQQSVIEVNTLKMAREDLDEYHKALETALMRFHSIKMEEVNKIIGEYWQATYRGNDIDTIEIKAEKSEEGARAYNYRVVMKKDGIELDMRGRCSAGQRVLACLVIRLALAETFCLHCGILALDEPTTNLDQDNIQSFAAAIARLIETRRSQSNFQLVVISHDEEFVQTIARLSQCDYCYRISKNEAACSVIEKQQIRSLL